MKGSFVVYLNDGSRFDFEKCCNQLSYTSEKVMVFKEVDNETKTERTLAVIPYSSIMYVLNNKKEDEEKGE